ncbi:hypothetical protein NE664_11930 [Anaerotignum faecicola]|nr:hypothetical protein [Anaerotignum faecicola]
MASQSAANVIKLRLSLESAVKQLDETGMSAKIYVRQPCRYSGYAYNYHTGCCVYNRNGNDGGVLAFYPTRHILMTAITTILVQL